ncbi:MAG: hypothetical protein Q9220_005888 [cf. Caloplaca sp. 1 TL-2023]
MAPNLGLAFGTIGDDNKFKLWREDPSQTPQSGRRFRCVFSQSPSTHVPYVSLDFTTTKADARLILVSKDGLLSLLEPTEPGSLHAWKELDTMYPFGQHARGSEPNFNLSIHQAERPSYEAISAGLDPKAISFCLSSNHSIKVIRATKSDESNYQLHEMLEITSIVSAVNGIAWAPGSFRPYDLIAAACNDGCVRLFEVTVLHDGDLEPHNHGPRSGSFTRERQSSSALGRKALSGIGAGLAGVSRGEPGQRRSGGSGIQHVSREVALLSHEKGSPVWKVRWTYDGSALASTGDNGRLYLWKRNVKGEYIEFADTGFAESR